MRTIAEVTYGSLTPPKPDNTHCPVALSDETMQLRYRKVLAKMKEANLDVLVIYADLEHGSNFEYLTGFVPRFEEALLILHQDGKNYMLMGNENLNKVAHARIPAEAIHVPYFSLPNQPMDGHDSLKESLEKAGIQANQSVGLVGWKNFTSQKEDNRKIFDLPYYIIEALHCLLHSMDNIVNATSLFIGEHGVRCINTVNELEHYEFGASLASDAMLATMDHLELGVSELELGDCLNALGQYNSVVTIASSGPRFVHANLYPTSNTVKLQDPISLTVGYKGGLSSRAGYAVEHAHQLPEAQQDYLDALVKPYFLAYATWLEQVHCGCSGDEVYQCIEACLPKAKYHWSLCPGHLSADEEWMSSPIYAGSEERLMSGMLFQIDIIPSMPGYAGTSAESTVALADASLREKIAQEAPELWKRIQQRRTYLIEELHIQLHPDILPMCSTVAYLRPFLLNKTSAMKLK